VNFRANSKRAVERIHRIKEYLFEDHEFVSGFGKSLDYESYWEKRTQNEDNPSGVERQVDKLLFSSRYKLIENLIEPKSRVLEIGCGDGSLLAHLKKTKNVEAFGIDVSLHAVELARANGISIQHGDISHEENLIPENIDYIIMVEVLEHLSNPSDVLMSLKGKYRKSLIVDIPNTGAINDRLRLLFGRFPRQWILHPSEHLHFWTVTDFLFGATNLGLTSSIIMVYMMLITTLVLLKCGNITPKCFRGLSFMNYQAPMISTKGKSENTFHPL
jgi:methionine biosynthesis protein MetW